MEIKQEEMNFDDNSPMIKLEEFYETYEESDCVQQPFYADFEGSYVADDKLEPEDETNEYICPDIREYLIIENGIDAREDVENDFKCSICGRSFERMVGLKIHRASHFEKPSFECEVCHIEFMKSGTLETHLQIHSIPKSYKCSTCSYSFRAHQSLDRHIALHLERTFRCKKCGRKYAGEKDLKAHIIRHKNKPKGRK